MGTNDTDILVDYDLDEDFASPPAAPRWPTVIIARTDEDLAPKWSDATTEAVLAEDVRDPNLRIRLARAMAGS